MFNASLQIFKKKAKPGSGPSITQWMTGGLRTVVSRQFSVSANESTPSEALRDAVQSRIMEISKNYLNDIRDSKPHRLTPKASFVQLGLDSLDSMDLIIEIEERLGIDLDDQDAESRISSIADAVQVFTEYASQGRLADHSAIRRLAV